MKRIINFLILLTTCLFLQYNSYSQSEYYKLGLNSDRNIFTLDSLKTKSIQKHIFIPNTKSTICYSEDGREFLLNSTDTIVAVTFSTGSWKNETGEWISFYDYNFKFDKVKILEYYIPFKNVKDITTTEYLTNLNNRKSEINSIEMQGRMEYAKYVLAPFSFTRVLKLIVTLSNSVTGIILIIMLLGITILLQKYLTKLGVNFLDFENYWGLTSRLIILIFIVTTLTSWNNGYMQYKGLFMWVYQNTMSSAPQSFSQLYFFKFQVILFFFYTGYAASYWIGICMLVSGGIKLLSAGANKFISTDGRIYHITYEGVDLNTTGSMTKFFLLASFIFYFSYHFIRGHFEIANNKYNIFYGLLATIAIFSLIYLFSKKYPLIVKRISKILLTVFGLIISISTLVSFVVISRLFIIYMG